MYFTTADGKTSVDVIMDRLNMCHVLDFADRIDRMPDTLDIADLLLTKLQVVELNEKDVHDIAPPALGLSRCAAGDEPGTIGLDRIGQARGRGLGVVADRHDEPRQGGPARGADRQHGDLVPEARLFEPAEQATTLRDCLRRGAEDH